jgi:crossover junction endodeoxyribonuclease RusA
MILTIPFPPSINHYWRSFRGRMLISKGGRDYRSGVQASALVERWASFGSELLTVSIKAYMPDARRRDIDNAFKAPLDALAHAGVYNDDSQIRRLSIENCGIDRENPRLEVTIEAYP